MFWLSSEQVTCCQIHYITVRDLVTISLLSSLSASAAASSAVLGSRAEPCRWPASINGGVRWWRPCAVADMLIYSRWYAHATDNRTPRTQLRWLVVERPQPAHNGGIYICWVHGRSRRGGGKGYTVAVRCVKFFVSTETCTNLRHFQRITSHFSLGSVLTIAPVQYEGDISSHIIARGFACSSPMYNFGCVVLRSRRRLAIFPLLRITPSKWSVSGQTQHTILRGTK